MPTRVVSVLVAVAAVVGAASGRQADSGGVTGTTISIGVESAVGSLSLDGENLGFKLAFEEANARGGVHGGLPCGPIAGARVVRRPACWRWPAG
jgi:hypothetical protein